MVLLDLADVLKAEEYYLLDNHAGPAGHRKVAAAMVPLPGRKR